MFINLSPAGVAVEGPSDMIEAAKPTLRRYKAEITAWLSRHPPIPPAPIPAGPPEAVASTTDLYHCVVCGASTWRVAGAWGHAHGFCARHFPLGQLPFGTGLDIRKFECLSSWQFETCERLSIMHDGAPCAALEPYGEPSPEAIRLAQHWAEIERAVRRERTV
jgi:hypothetical protein